MHTNEDIQKFMLNANRYAIKDKLNEVALIIASPSQKYNIARKLKKTVG